MKVLFAVSNDNITTSVVNKYQQKFKEIITSKNVYYFNAIVKELQKDKSYDAIVIGEDLEPISNNNYEAVDKFLFEKLDGISDEASKQTGEEIPIIFICSDRRVQSDQLLIKLFGIGIYNAIIGNDRSIDTVCNLINKPRSKKDAKNYYKVESEQVGLYESGNDQDVSETEIQSILSHYKKIGPNVKKCVESFNSIAGQYNETQLRIIINFLPNEVKSILEANSSKYQKLVNGGTVLSNGTYQTYQKQNPRKPGTIDFLAKDLEKTTMTKPVIIPSTININQNNLSQMRNRGQYQNPMGQGVNRGNMLQMDNGIKNANISETAHKRGRGRPRKAMATPTTAQPQAVVQPSASQPQAVVQPSANQPQAVVQPSASQPQAVVPPSANQPQAVMPPSVRPPQAVVPSVSQPQAVAVPTDEPKVTESTTHKPKRKRGRPPKQTNVATEPVVSPTPSVQSATPSESEQNLNHVNLSQSQDESQSNAFDDILPGLEENDNTVDLFSMDPLDDTQNTMESSVLPGFDNDIENVNLNEESSNDTNLFDLDIEENTQDTLNMPTAYDEQTTQNSTFNNVNSNQSQTNNNSYNAMNNSYDANSNSYNAMNNSYDANSNSYNAMNNTYDANSNSYNAMNNSYDKNIDPYRAMFNPYEVNNVPYNNTNSYGPNNGYNNMNNTYDTNTNNGYNNGGNPYNTNNNYNGMNNSYGQNQNAGNMYNSYNQNNNANPYMPNNYENSMTSTMQQNDYNNNNVLAENGKIVVFVGTTKNGTSFIVNNLAQLLSQNGVKTAVLDLTKNKNSYYMFTDNDSNLMKKATDSLKNLSNGLVDGLDVNKNLTVFTSLPEENEELNKDVILNTLSNNFEIALLDCDFETQDDYFVSANEIYLIQSMDTFTIQPLTQFLSDLKLKNMLDESKLRIVINKYIKLKKLDEKLIIGGMSKYNEPSMTLQRDLFNANTIKYITIPFETETYARYLDSIAMCSLSLNGYSPNFLQALEELKNMVYPLISGGNRSINQQNNTDEKHGLFGGKKNKQQVQSTQFSNNVNNTLNRMRTNNF